MTGVHMQPGAWVALAVIAVLGVGALAYQLTLSKSARSRRLRRVGRDAVARVAHVHRSGWAVDNIPFVKITVERDGSRAAFWRVARGGVPEVGESIDVVYDPSRPDLMLPMADVYPDRVGPAQAAKNQRSEHVVEDVLRAFLPGADASGSGHQAHAVVCSRCGAPLPEGLGEVRCTYCNTLNMVAG